MSDEAKQVVVLVVGWSTPTEVDEAAAIRVIEASYNAVEAMFVDHEVVLVSGLTDVGIMRIAYREATRRDWFTSGYACGKARDFDLFPVDEQNIIGEDWGDESQSFIERGTRSGHPFGIINVAGGPQASREMEAVRQVGGFVLDFPLGRTK